MDMSSACRDMRPLTQQECVAIAVDDDDDGDGDGSLWQGEKESQLSRCKGWLHASQQDRRRSRCGQLCSRNKRHDEPEPVATGMRGGKTACATSAHKPASCESLVLCGSSADGVTLVAKAR